MKKSTQEEKLEKIKSILSQKNGKIDDDLKKEIQSFTKEKRESQVSNINKDISSQFNSDQIISNLQNVEQPDILKDIIRKNFSSMLDPMRMSFISEV